MTTTTHLPVEPASSECPSWCTEHTGFSDGSDNWHESATRRLHGFAFYVSAGTPEHDMALFMPETGCKDGMTLAEAEETAIAILELVKAARA
jgi:hypothetical protein